MTTTLYIAGPMRGVELFNFPAFDDAAKRLRAHGYQVKNPAELDRVWGFSEYTAELPTDFLRQAMKRDLSAICDHCDGLALLPGWEKSQGTGVEIALADLLGLKVHAVESWLEMEVG